MQQLFALLALSLITVSAHAEVLQDITCKVHGRTAEGYKTPLTVQAQLTPEILATAERVGNQEDGCRFDEFYTPSSIFLYNPDGSLQGNLRLIANVCGDSDVYWFAELRSDHLFPHAGEISYSIDPTDYNRVLIGSEGSDEYGIPLAGDRFQFLYLDCAPTEFYAD